MGLDFSLAFQFKTAEKKKTQKFEMISSLSYWSKIEFVRKKKKKWSIFVGGIRICLIYENGYEINRGYNWKWLLGGRGGMWG